MLRTLLATTLLCHMLPARAAGDPIPAGARLAGMGHAGITLVDLWAVRANQAGLAGLEKPLAGAYYQQHWLAPDLAAQGLAFALPVGKGTFAASAGSFGNELYLERQFGLAYAMRLSDALRVGVQLDHLQVRLGEGYGSRGTMIAQIGVQARLTKALWIGAHLYNPGRATLGGPYEERPPTVMRLGLGYTFHESVLLTAEVEKDIDRPERFRAGLEYRPHQHFFLRTGVSTGPAQAHFGAGLRLRQLEVDIAAVVRSQLGLTPMVSLNYRFG